ncbi:MAG: deoxyribodipyrimidine photo-lyase [Cryomorphaceae bacterium]
MSKPAHPLTLFWFRRDLRLEDNHGLYQALKNEKNVQPIFIFDSNILNKLEDKDDRRVSFIHAQIVELEALLNAYNAHIWVYAGEPEAVLQSLVKEHTIEAVYANHDYEPYATQRDGAVDEMLRAAGVRFQTFKDQVVFERDEVIKEDGSPYVVYSPYMRKWKSVLREKHLASFPTLSHGKQFYKSSGTRLLTLKEIGFEQHPADWGVNDVDPSVIKHYHQTRDIPGILGTSRLSHQLRFGTLSIRALMRAGSELNEKWFNELIWREFYQSILWHFPRVTKESFRKEYDHIEWRNNEEEFEAWCAGRTGYPIVDAGMRELNQTGFMHNRVRMITASFLTKHLLIDWRWGEAYFARKLIDFDLASNNGGWQWAAGCGVDAAPYFRVFNPYLQTEKFDPQKEYIRTWVPEFDTDEYPEPLVDHKFARNRVLEVYKAALKPS